MKRDDQNRKWVRDLGLFSVVLGDMIGYTGAGVGLGYVAWRYLNAPIWVIAITALGGLALASYRVYETIKKL